MGKQPYRSPTICRYQRWMRYRLSTLHLITLFKTYLDTYTYSTKALSL